MSGLVLLAKHTLVWLGQLSKAYGRKIRRLDQIPEAELDRIAARGINGLWLIGIWRRSAASRRIKQLSGNAAAAPSAYSIYDYTVDAELGGEAALEELARRAAERGIRLASDVVPNHLGSTLGWMAEHPERFLSVPESPFPGYSFTGEDLSSSPGMEVRLEDRYYDRSDAAVVFERLDPASGSGATSTTVTTVPPCPGTTRPSSTT